LFLLLGRVDLSLKDWKLSKLSWYDFYVCVLPLGDESWSRSRRARKQDGGGERVVVGVVHKPYCRERHKYTILTAIGE
jgi:hypothetical protein